MGKGKRQETPLRRPLQGTEGSLEFPHQSCTRRQDQCTKCKIGTSCLLSLTARQRFGGQSTWRISYPQLEVHKLSPGEAGPEDR